MRRKESFSRDPHAPAAPTIDHVADRVAQLLRANHGVDYCGGCLSTLLAVGEDRIAAATAILLRQAEFRADHWICFRCRQARPIVRAVRGRGADA